jgi:hypothetical protein
VVVAPVDVAHGTLLCEAHADESRLIIKSLYPFTVPVSERLLLAEFVARANRRIGLGTLTVDLDDGEIEFKTAMALGGDGWDSAVVGSIMEQQFHAADRWLPGVAATCFADFSPRAALELCIRTSAARIIERASELLDRE